MAQMGHFLVLISAILGTQILVANAQLSNSANRLRSPLATNDVNFNLLPRIRKLEQFEFSRQKWKA